MFLDDLQLCFSHLEIGVFIKIFFFSMKVPDELKPNKMDKQVLAATQTPGEKGNRWFQGTADAVRQFTWVFEVGDYDCIFTKYCILVISIIGFCLIHEGCQEQEY